MEIAKQQQVAIVGSGKILPGNRFKIYLVQNPGAEQAIIGECEFFADTPQAMAELLRQANTLVPRMIKLTLSPPNPGIEIAPAGLADAVKAQ